MVMVDLLQKINLVSNFFNIFESFESSLLRTCSLFYPIKTLVHDIITCGRGYFHSQDLVFSILYNHVPLPCLKMHFCCFLRSMPEKVGQETLKKKKNFWRFSISRKVEKKKSVLGLLFQMDNSLRKSWKLPLFCLDFKSTHIITEPVVCFGEGNTSDYFWGTKFK